MNEPLVQGTGDDAAVSKQSMAALGYVDDKFIGHMVRRKARRAPLINRGYYARVAAVWKACLDFFRAVGGPAGAQVVSLGAGFDTLFFRLREAGKAPSRFFEVDFADQIAKKSMLVRKHKLLPPDDDDDGGTDNKALYLLSADLRDTDALERALRENGCDFARPTLFLSECVLVYMPPESSDALVAWAARAFAHAHTLFLLYEQIHPSDPFGRMMVKNLESRGCSLLGLQAHPDLPSQERRFTTRGWALAKALDMNAVYDRYLPRDDVRRVEKIEMFDEFEEWHLIQGHYCICVAQRGAAGGMILGDVWAVGVCRAADEGGEGGGGEDGGEEERKHIE